MLLKKFVILNNSEVLRALPHSEANKINNKTIQIQVLAAPETAEKVF